MVKYHGKNPSLVQLAQAQDCPKIPSYAKTLMHFQLKDHPIYPGLNSPDLMGGGRR
jgi:hypothetical protein